MVGITRQTGVLLAEDLGIEAVEEVGDAKLTNLIRWGNGSPLRYNPKNTINKKMAVLNAVDKLRATELMRKHDVPVPILTDEPPCVGRTAQHTQGQGFWFCWRRDQIPDARNEGADYFIKYIPTKQEYRVHVLGGDAAFVQVKYQREHIGTAFRTIQGFRDGWHKVVHPVKKAPANVIKAAENACKALGLDMGGVDVLLSLDDKPFVLEVNTGPALPTKETRAPYVDFIKDHLVKR